MVGELDNVDGTQDKGINWSGRFRVRVNSLSLVGWVNVRMTLNIGEEDIPDAGTTMPIGKSLNTFSLSFQVTIRSLSGGNADDPDALAGNVELLRKAISNEQFDLEVTERNLKKRTDWIFKTVVFRGCTHKGGVNLIDADVRGGSPTLQFGGSALEAVAQVGSQTWVFSGLSQ